MAFRMKEPKTAQKACAPTERIGGSLVTSTVRSLEGCVGQRHLTV